MKKIIKLISINGATLIIAVVWGITQNAFVSFANPYALKLLFDEATIKHNFGKFVLIAVAAFLIFVGWRISSYFYSIFVEKLKNSFSRQLSVRALENYFLIPYTVVIKNQRGYFITRIFDDVRNMSESIEIILEFFNSLFMIFGAMAILLLISWELAIVLLVIIIPMRYISMRYSKDITELSVKEREQEARVKNTLGEIVSSYKFAKFYNLVDMVEKNFVKILNSFLSVALERFKISMGIVTLNRTVMSAAEIVVIIAGGYMMMKNTLTFGDFMGFMNAFWYVVEAFFAMIEIYPQIKKFEGVAQRIQEFDNMAKLPHKNVIYDPDINFIELRKVTYAYNGKSIFRDLDFKLEKGEKVLIVGPNGTGKTTLGALLAGLLTPDKGQVITFPSERISAILMPFSFPPVKISDIVEAMNSSNVTEELGIGHLINKYFNELSEGEKKKFKISIGLAKQADLYIFDEPLANVDEKSKETVMDAILKYTRGKTLVVIMHGDSKYHKHFDPIVDIENLI